MVINTNKPEYLETQRRRKYARSSTAKREASPAERASAWGCAEVRSWAACANSLDFERLISI